MEGWVEYVFDSICGYQYQYQVSYDCVPLNVLDFYFIKFILIVLCFVVEQAADSEWKGSEYVQPDVGAVWCE